MSRDKTNPLREVYRDSPGWRETKEWAEAKAIADQQNALQSERSKTTPFRFYPYLDLTD